MVAYKKGNFMLLRYNENSSKSLLQLYYLYHQNLKRHTCLLYLQINNKFSYFFLMIVIQITYKYILGLKPIEIVWGFRSLGAYTFD